MSKEIIITFSQDDGGIEVDMIVKREGWKTIEGFYKPVKKFNKFKKSRMNEGTLIFYGYNASMPYDIQRFYLKTSDVNAAWELVKYMKEIEFVEVILM